MPSPASAGFPALLGQCAIASRHSAEAGPARSARPIAAAAVGVRFGQARPPAPPRLRAVRFAPNLKGRCGRLLNAVNRALTRSRAAFVVPTTNKPRRSNAGVRAVAPPPPPLALAPSGSNPPPSVCPRRARTARSLVPAFPPQLSPPLAVPPRRSRYTRRDRHCSRALAESGASESSHCSGFPNPSHHGKTSANGFCGGAGVPTGRPPRPSLPCFPRSSGRIKHRETKPCRRVLLVDKKPTSKIR